MTFPVESTSVETAATKRVVRVLARSNVAGLIERGEVFACRHIANTSLWSDHAFGAAVDLFPKGPAPDHDEIRRRIFHAVIEQTTHPTKANRRRRLVVRYVIDHSARLIWTPSAGVHAYTGTTGDHVHVSDGPEPVGTPPCAG